MNETTSTITETQATSHRADTLIGTVVFVLGAAVLAGALAMPRFEHRSADPLTVPGITPGLLGAIILVLGAMLALRGAYRAGTEGSLPITQWSQGSVRRTLFTLGALLVYGFVLFGNLPFVPATSIFVFGFTVGVELMREDRSSTLATTLAGAAVLAILSSFIIWLVFSKIFLIQIPG
ncbi:MAG: tripartite tricarboxylate transporter TctB family protein [Devosiaceae bacterium]